MNWDQKEILSLPSKCLLETRLTKAFFLKHFPLKSSEKKTLNQHILSMQWLASIRPTNSNILPLINETYAYEEIQIFTVNVDESVIAKQKQIIDLIHRYVPFHILLILYSDQSLIYSVCDKRINLADTSKRTIESFTQTPIINLLYRRETENAFLGSLHFRNLDKTNLETTYASYMQAIVQYNAACITGSYQVRNQTRTAKDMQVLQDIDKLKTDIISLKNQIKKADSFSDKTKLNIELQKKKSSISKLEQVLKSS